VQALGLDGVIRAQSWLPVDAVYTGAVGERWLFVHGPSTRILGPDLRTVDEVPGAVHAVDGTPFRVVDGGFELLDPATFEQVRSVRFQGAEAGASPSRWEALAVVDGKWWTRWAAEPRFRILDPADGSVVAAWPELTGDATYLGPLSDRRLLCGKWDGTWTILDTRSGSVVAVLRDGHARGADALELPGDRLLTLDWDGRLVTWDLSVVGLPPEQLRERVQAVTGTRWEDGRLVEE
jgi:hypothetical protein